MTTVDEVVRLHARAAEARAAAHAHAHRLHAAVAAHLDAGGSPTALARALEVSRDRVYKLAAKGREET